MSEHIRAWGPRDERSGRWRAAVAGAALAGLAAATTAAHAQDSAASGARAECFGGSFDPACDTGAGPAPGGGPIVPPPPPTKPVWLVLNGQQAGPFTPDQLATLVANGQLTPTTLVWIEGMAGWEPARDVPTLASVLGAATTASDTTTASDGTTAQDAAADPLAEPTAFLAGTWQIGPSEVPVAQGVTGVMVQRLAFGADGSMEVAAEMRAEAGGQSMVITNRGRGRFSATHEGGGRLLIRPEVEVTTSAPGMPDQTDTWRDPLRVRVVDERTLADEYGATMSRVDG